jgi:diguanylate cyclase (GGDEF)-like protein
MPPAPRANRVVSSPPLPASFLAIQIVQAAAKPNATVQELATLCQNDPGFVMRALAYVNSAGVSLNRRVTSVQHAVALLGIRGTRNLALGMCVLDLTPNGTDGAALLSVCLRRAVIAKLLAEKLERQNPDDYFTVGLLLEIGLLVKARSNIESAVEIAGAAANTRVTLERAAGQEDHAKLGSRLARSWQLGEEMATALLYHHDRLPRGTPLSETIWLTEAMAGVFEGGDAPRLRVQAIEAGNVVSVPAAVIDEVLRLAPEGVAEAARSFGRDIGPQVSVDALLRDTNEAIGELNRNYTEVVTKLESLLHEKEALHMALRAADEKLANLALTDSISGLPNHRAFQELLTRDLARADRSKTHIALLLVDVDHFAHVNQTHGPSAADVVLSGVAEVLLHCVRTSDVLARVAGETFALLLPATNLQGTMIVAERARARIAERVFTSGQGTFQITASLGVAVTMGPNCRTLGPALLNAAESGLEMAKQAGRNRIMVGSL